MNCAIGVNCVVARVYTGDGSGLLVAWVMGLWGSSLASFPLLSSLNKGRISSSFSMAHILYLIVGHPAVPQEELLLIQLSIPLEAAVEPAHPKLLQSSTYPLDFLPLYDQAVGRALKLNIVGCQLADPLHFETHLMFVPGGPPQYKFFDSIGH